MKKIHLLAFRDRISIYQTFSFILCYILLFTVIFSGERARAEENILIGKVTIKNECHWPSKVHFYSYDRPFQCALLPKIDLYLKKEQNGEAHVISEVKNLIFQYESCGYCVEPLGSVLSCSGQHLYPDTQRLGTYFEFKRGEKEVSITCKTLPSKYTSAQPDNCFCMQDPWPPEWDK